MGCAVVIASSWTRSRSAGASCPLTASPSPVTSTMDSGSTCSPLTAASRWRRCSAPSRRARSPAAGMRTCSLRFARGGSGRAALARVFRVSARAPIVRVLAASLAFGLFAAWAKGTGGGQGLPGLRNGIGSLSTPWLLVAFVAGTQSPRLRSGALLGLAATMVALLGFYLLSSIVQDLGGHGFVGDLRLELNANHGYLEGGVFTGPV